MFNVGEELEVKIIALEVHQSFAQMFAMLLAYIVETDGVCDGENSIKRRCGGTLIGQFTGEIRPSLTEPRNALAHGDPFDGLANDGLLKLVRDLINFVYRHYIPEAETIGFVGGSNSMLATLPIVANAQ